MTYINGFLQNRVLISGVLAWAVAQIIKTVIYTIIHKEFRPERLIGDGGMPSCHSATVCSVATATAIMCGVDSPVFAVSVILAIIVMHDAMGVRLETGKQAQILNFFMDMFKPLQTDEWPDEKLKEFVGHTPSQVTIGAILGVVLSLYVNLVLW